MKTQSRLLIAITLAITIGGCAKTFHVAKRTNTTAAVAKSEIVHSPETNKVSSVELGETMLSKAYRQTYPAIKTHEETIYTGPRADGKSIEIRIAPGLHKAILQDGSGTFYSRDSKYEPTTGSATICVKGVRDCGRVAGGIYVQNSDQNKTEVFFFAADTRLPINYSKDNIQFSPATYEQWTKDSFKRELVYTGISGSTISISYREFKDDIARPAFSQELRYDLSQGKEIGYRGARFEVISANNTSIHYRVLKPLD